ncbi:MAG: two-component system response regulator CreB [Deltaproteobacteria bacterium]|nr:two-component system response regulator CreB [Deltaproteobacteria bacterium]
MKKKILIVEDEPSIADNITYALSTEGFEPLWCGTGSEALDEFEKSGIALIILDIGLPDINGFELARIIRSNSDIPIIFLTARSDEIDRVAGLELGADDYVVKPFSPRELAARVRAVLRRSVDNGASSQQKKSQRLPFEIDEKKFIISYYGESLDLTRYEFRLLQLLITSPGRVYSRDQLMERVWEEPEMSLDRTVDTHIKTIRQKLKSIKPDEEVIITHRGVGYSLKEY